MKEEKMVDVEIDIPDDVMVRLAHYAHDHDITINQAMNKILTQYIEKHDPTYLLKPLERDLVNRISDMNENLTVETVIKFTKSYIEWLDNQNIKTKPLADLIQVGFDIAEQKLEQYSSSFSKDSKGEEFVQDGKQRSPICDKHKYCYAQDYELDSSGTGDEEY